MKKSFSTMMSVVMILISGALLIIGSHFRLAFAEFNMLSDLDLTMAADLDIRWFIGPYAYFLIIAGVILMLMAAYNIYRNR